MALSQKLLLAFGVTVFLAQAVAAQQSLTVSSARPLAPAPAHFALAILGRIAPNPAPD